MHTTPSRFVRKTLMPDEHFVREARFSSVYTVEAWLLWGFCIAVGYGIHYIFNRYLGQYTHYPISLGSLVGLWLFAAMMMKKWTTEIILTDQRLIHKHGFFQISMSEVDIEQLASDKVGQSFIGRMFDYGEIYVRCIEAPDMYLPPVRRPYEFRNAIEQQKHLYREHYMKVERLRHHGAKPEDEQ